jgi:hypothetical protein
MIGGKRYEKRAPAFMKDKAIGFVSDNNYALFDHVKRGRDLGGPVQS